MRILIVDDDEVFARSLKRSFALEGAEATLAAGVEDARDHLIQQSFDLVVLDLMLEGTNGLCLLQTWTGETSLPPIVILSGHVDVRETVRCMRAGAVCVLQKPATPGQILAHVERLRGEQLLPSSQDLRDATQVILGEHGASQGVSAQVRKLARFRTTNVFLSGETGTGKSTVAQALHEQTDASAPFVALNCAAIPESLFESELFGYEAHAFTGAKKRRAGLFERAGNGTVFLDEVAELSLSAQPKLLRALETREFFRVGGNRPIPLEARVVSATHRPQLVESQQFRSDLYYRLAGFSISLSPLRERSDQIEPLAHQFLWAFAARHPGTPTRFTRSAVERLASYSWPGNLRELKTVIARVAILGSGALEISREVIERVLSREDFGRETGSGLRPSLAKTGSLKDLERATIAQAFRESNGNVSEAARRIGLPRSTVRDRLRRYGMA